MARWRWVGLVAVAILIVTASASLADEGDLDPMFSEDGFDLPGVPDHSFGSAVAIDEAGRIVAAGSGGSPGQPVVVRYQPNGSLDDSFGDAGVVVVPMTGHSADVALDSAGRIVVAGTDRDVDQVLVMRFLASGELDDTFAGDGIATAPVGTSASTAASVAIDNTGRIVVSGTADNGVNLDAFVMRFLSTGDLDSSFADSGVFVLDSGEWEWGGDVAIDAEGRIVLAAPTGILLTIEGSDWDPQVIRLLDDGTLDSSFGTDGKVVTKIGPLGESAYALAIDDAGRIVIAGETDDVTHTNEDLLVIRYLPDGSLDPSFSDDGIVVLAMSDGSDGGQVVGFDRVGNIVVGGHTKGCCPDSWDAVLLRFRPDGSLDSAFSDDGIAIESIRGGFDSISDIAVDRSGDMIVAGSAGGSPANFHFWVGRFQGAGWFVDDIGSVFEDDINALAAAGITAGCNPPDNDQYCPLAGLTRGQMAAFLNRALGLTATTEDFFVDDDGSVFEDDINRLAAAGITAGCNPPDNDQYCPGAGLTRGQMAAFLVRALGLT